MRTIANWKYYYQTRIKARKLNTSQGLTKMFNYSRDRDKEREEK